LAAGQHGDPRHPRAGRRRARPPRRAHARRQDRERHRQSQPGVADTAERRDRVNLRESVGIALGALRANKLRSFLTLLGTIIGVMSVIFVVSVVQGLNRYVADKLIQAGSNVFSVDKWGFVTSQEEYEARKNWPDVTLEDADALHAGVPHASIVMASAQ